MRIIEVIWQWLTENQNLLELFLGLLVSILGLVMTIVWRKIDKKKEKEREEQIKQFFKNLFFSQMQSYENFPVEHLINPRTWKDWVLKGIAVHLEKNFDLAIKYYETSIFIHPHHEAYCYMGLAYLENNNDKKATSSFKKSIKINPNFSNAYCYLGFIHEFYHNNSKEALMLYNKALELTPNNIIVYICICCSCILNNDLIKAKEYLLKIHEFNSNVLELNFLEGLIHLYERKIGNTTLFWNSIIGLDHNKKEEILLIKKLLLETNKIKQNWKSPAERQEFEQKYIQLRNLIEIDPNNSEALHNMGNLFYDMGEYNYAIKYYKMAIKLSPDNENPYYDLGWLYHEVRKNNKMATNCFNKAIEINPCFAKAYNGFGSICDDERKYKAAIEYYKKAIELDNNYTAAYNNLAVIYLKEKEYEFALKYAIKAIKITPNFIQAYTNILRAYIAQKEYYEPIKWLDQLIDVRPNCPKAFLLAGFGYILIGENQYQKGIECLQTSHQLGFKPAGTLVKLFKILGYSKLSINIGRRIFNNV